MFFSTVENKRKKEQEQFCKNFVAFLDECEIPLTVKDAFAKGQIRSDYYGIELSCEDYPSLTYQILMKGDSLDDVRCMSMEEAEKRKQFVYVGGLRTYWKGALITKEMFAEDLEGQLGIFESQKNNLEKELNELDESIQEINKLLLKVTESI